MRVFAAFPIPPVPAAAIDAALGPLRQKHPRVRWVPASGMHVTVHFFADIPPAAVSSLLLLFAQAEDLRCSRIPARLGSLGQFPPRGSPRVIWAGLQLGEEEMKRYVDLFETRIAPLGWSPDPRGFTAHITVARVGGLPLDSGWDAGVVIPPVDFFVEECVLFQSILGRAGAVYQPLARIAFG